MSTQTARDGAAAALFPKTRRAVLGLLYSHPGQQFYLREIVEMTGLAVGQVQRELAVLSTAGILERREQGRHVYFQANPDCPVHVELRSIVAKTMGAVSTVHAALGSLSDRIRVAFVFGSVARGEETAASDLDVMVVGTATFPVVSDAIRTAEAALRREINLTVYPTEEFRAKVSAGHHFLTQVLRREKLFIVGNERELAAVLEQPLNS